jgi:hypothetical protein
MVALLVAAVLWHAPAVVRVPNGERRTIEAPAVAGPARLVFRAHADYWRPAGSNPLLRVLVDGREVGLMRDRWTPRLGTPRLAGDPERADGLPRFDFGRWRVSQGPGTGDELAFDVSDLLPASGPVRVEFEAAPAGSLGPTPLVIEDARLEAGTVAAPVASPPDWRRPRLALPDPPSFTVEADRNVVRLSWDGVTREIRTVASEGGGIERTREIVRHADRVEVRDTFVNTGSVVVALHVRHAVATDTVWTHLGGRLDPSDADAYSPWNPTVFTPVGTSAGLGLVAEDDVLRQQLYVDADPATRTIGMRTDMLCLAPGDRKTLVWSAYPIRTASYWDFINRVRMDWLVDRTIPGSFVWFTPDAILAMPLDRLRERLDQQRTAIASLFGGWVDPLRKDRPPFIGFGTGVLRDELADYRRRLTQAVQRLKEARPDIAVLLYFDTQRDSAPDATRRFADSLIVDAGGNRERVDWSGQFSPSWGMVPTPDDGFGRAMRDVVTAMRGLGADGLYWDEMDGVD